MFPGGGAGVGGEESAWKANINQRDPAAVQHSQPLHHVLPTNRIRGNSEARPEMGARVKSAEQLPPLSSILQGSGLALPSHSSNALDLSPHYLALSPGSLKRTSAARLQQEQWDGPQARPQSEPTTQFAYLHSNHSFSSTDASPRSQFSPSDFRKPTSPGYYDPTKYDSLESQQERLRSSSVRWSPKANGRFREYLPPMAADGTFNRSGTQSPNAGEQTFTTVQSRIELESIQRQNDGSISSARSFAQSSNSKTSIGTSTKDTLGPKIWTGAHFLPRFVREAEVPGEGPCYFYDDGTYCKTVIDDEPVNAHWGVTKAGKPRKRLAIACITCREKKIKCDPDYPRCVQCEKFGRVCRFKNAPRGGHGSPETSAADTDEMNTLSVSDTSELEPLKLSQPEAPYPVTTAMNDQRAQQQQRLHGNDLKRRKSGYVTYTPAKPESSTSFYSAPNPPAPVPNDLPLQPQPLHQSHPTFTAQFRPLPPSQYTAPSHNMSFSSTPVSTLSGSHYPVHALAYSAPPGNYILTGSGDKKIRLFNPFPSTDGSRGAVKAGKLIQEFNGHGYEVSDICVASDNASFASCGGDRAVFLWDVSTTSVTRKFSGNNGHTAKVNCVAFAGQDTSVLVSGSFDATVRLWDLKSKSHNPIQVFDDARDSIQTLLVHGERILVGSVDGRVRSYDVRMGRCVTDVLAVPVTSLAATRDGEGYLAGTLDGKIRLMDWGSGGCLKTYSGADGGEYRIKSIFGGNERWVVSGSEGDSEVLVWDTMTGEMSKRVSVPRNDEAMKTKVDKFGKVVERKNVISCVAWRNDGKTNQWCCAGTDGQVTVFGDVD